MFLSFAAKRKKGSAGMSVGKDELIVVQKLEEKGKSHTAQIRISWGSFITNNYTLEYINAAVAVQAVLQYALQYSFPVYDSKDVSTGGKLSSIELPSNPYLQNPVHPDL